MNSSLSYLPASWPATPDDTPENVHAFTTLKPGGFSRGDFAEFNLAKHVGDNVSSVNTNRKKLLTDLQLPAEPVWLEQVHSNKVICADEVISGSVIKADASIARKKGVICVAMTADCLPVFFCNTAGTEVAIAHAGWRGLCDGIISNTVNAMQTANNDILVSLGPAIGAQAFTVGEDVYCAFVAKNSLNKTAFSTLKADQYLCDIYQLARIELQTLLIDKISGGSYCTYHEQHRFFSYRRQNITGRMASLIWLS